MSLLFAGAAAVDITPSGPQWLDGYGGRTEPSDGVYLPIWAKGLALRTEGASALLVSAEVLGFDRARVAPLKARIAAETGVPAEAVILLATHTHCAPRVCDMVMPGEVDPEYRAWFEDRCVEAAARAWRGLAPARLAFSRAQDTLGVNRRVLTEDGVIMRPNPEGPRDADVDTLWFEDEGGRVHSSLTVAACHPTCRGGQQIGGDYPGFLMRELEGALGGVALLALGCAGDVRPGFTRETGGFRMAELEEVEQAGKTLAAAVLGRRGEREYPLVQELRVARRTLAVPLAELPGREALEAVASGDGSPLRRQWARNLLAAGPDRLPREVEFELQGIGFHPGAALVAWPGEVAAEYALWVKGLAPGGTRMLAAAYANGAVGYVPSAAMYPLGGYEVNGSHYYYHLPAPYAPDVEERLRRETLGLLKEML